MYVVVFGSADSLLERLRAFNVADTKPYVLLAQQIFNACVVLFDWASNFLYVKSTWCLKSSF